MTDSKEKPSGSSTHVQVSLLGPAEKRLLVWMGGRLPAWMRPDFLTFLGLAGLIFVGAAYFLARNNPLWLVGASIGLVVNWFGDSMDGTVARVRHRQRPKYGYYCDHLVDAFGTAFLMFGLAYSGLMSPVLGMIVLTLYLIMSINAYLATHTVGEFRISYAGVSPTEGRIFLILLNATLIFRPEITLFSRTFRIMDIGGSITAVALLAILVASAVSNLWKLDRQERALWKLDPPRGEPRQGESERNT